MQVIPSNHIALVSVVEININVENWISHYVSVHVNVNVFGLFYLCNTD